MAEGYWQTGLRRVASLHLDSKNPRLGRETTAQAPREIVQYLFEHDKAMEVAQSIATRGYFSNEPLLAIQENEKLVVIEGNRRLAALIALREPGLLEGAAQRQIERLSRQVADRGGIAQVPVTIAPSRRAADCLLAGRHVGTSVLPWIKENRASFILDKLEEGYTNDQLRDEIGFTLSDIQEARQTRAIAEMARSLDLPDEVRIKLEKPRASVFTTLERVMESLPGREYLHVKPDPDHGLRGVTTKTQFLLGFRRLVLDVASGDQSSRSLNKADDIREYFQSWDPKDLPGKKRGSFVPADVIRGRSVASVRTSKKPAKASRSQPVSRTVLPKSLKVRHGSERLKDIRRELGKLKRDDFPNAGAVLLRVFTELSIREYLEREGELQRIISKIEKKGVRLAYGVPTMKQLVPEVTRIAKDKLKMQDALMVEKALKYDPAAPFTISELHGFVHHHDLPSARDIHQFWTRVEPLFRLMLEGDESE